MIKYIKKTIEEITNKISKRKCLFCNTNLDKEFGERSWHIPLCRKHRKEFMEEGCNE